LIDRALGEASRKSFAMLPQGQQFFSEYYLEARREGEAKGKAEGLTEGKAEGLAEAVITVLEARGLRVTADQRARILATTDVVTIDEWVKRATTIDDAEGLFVQAV
jgi:predicted transposase YdaD